MINHRMSAEVVEGDITAENYYVFPGTTMTVCCITIRGCLHVTGESDCVNPEAFNEKRGRDAARSKAMVKVWDQAAIALKLELYGTKSVGEGDSRC